MTTSAKTPLEELERLWTWSGAIIEEMEEIRGRLVSVRGDLLTVAVEVPRRRRVTINKYSMRSIEEVLPKVSRSGTTRRLSKVFWR